VLQRLIYGSADVIIVTDESRLNLLPAWSKTKAVVLPNFPLSDSGAVSARDISTGALKIFLSGSIGVDRGIPFLLNLLKHDLRN
jgi:hypothetical protein